MVKTGVARELAPIDPDWYYVRAAALARKVYLFPGRGVGSYSKVYGGAQDNGTKRSHHRVAATGVIRNALQSLEKLGLIQTADKCVFCPVFSWAAFRGLNFLPRCACCGIFC